MQPGGDESRAAVRRSDDGASHPGCGGGEAKLYNCIEADEYEIGLVQYRSNFSSSLPACLVRGYVQLTARSLRASTMGTVRALQRSGDCWGCASTGYCGLTPPQYLGPVIAATKDKPVRIIFRNLLPADRQPDGISYGDLFLPLTAP